MSKLKMLIKMFLDLQSALLFTGGAIPYTFQNGMAVIPVPGQEYSMFASQVLLIYYIMFLKYYLEYI